MTQDELNQAVAEMTGEDIRTVRQRGFSLMTPLEPADELDSCDPEENMIDWDLFDLYRNVPVVDHPRRVVAA